MRTQRITDTSRPDPKPSQAQIPGGHRHPGAPRADRPAGAPPPQAAQTAQEGPILLLSTEPNRLRRETGFQCVIKFRNDLPEISCDPKLLLPNVPASKLAAFQLTSLERQVRCEPDITPDLGLHHAPLDASALDVPDEPGPLDPRDEALCTVDDEASAQGRAARTGELSWLLRTSYLTSGGGGQPGRVAATSTAETEARITREERIAAIEATFEAASRPPVHATKPELKPIEVLPLLPDEALEERGFVLSLFDSDPALEVPSLAHAPDEERKLARAAFQLKSFAQRREDGSVDKFVAFLVKESVPKLSSDPSEDVAAADLAGDYTWIREYDSRVDVDEPARTYLFRLAEGRVGYVDLGTRLTLRKRVRAVAEDADQFVQPSKVVFRIPESAEGETEE